MTTVFIDTSALLAVLDADDFFHKTASSKWSQLLLTGTNLFCSSYVILETYALTQHRLGIDALRVLHEDIYPLLHVHWVDSTLHEAGMSGILTAGRKGLSLADCVSFALMRRLGIRKAFTFDRHFREQGFEVV